MVSTNKLNWIHLLFEQSMVTDTVISAVTGVTELTSTPLEAICNFEPPSEKFDGSCDIVVFWHKHPSPVGSNLAMFHVPPTQ